MCHFVEWCILETLWHAFAYVFLRGVTRTGDIVACSCIRVIRGVACTGDVVSCSCIRVTRGVARTGDVAYKPIGLIKGGHWV